MNDDHIIFLLNTLGQAYLTCGAFNPTKEILVDINNKFCKKMIVDFIADKDYTIVGDYILSFSETLLQKISETTIKHNIVILEYPKFKESVIDSYKWYNERCYYDNYKSYFTTNNPYAKITISAKEKRSKITIYDILAASCELAIVPNKLNSVVDIEYGGYQKSYYYNNSILRLSPGFDNNK